MVSFNEILSGTLKFHVPPSTTSSVGMLILFCVGQLLLGLGQFVVGLIDRDMISVYIAMFWFLIGLILSCCTVIPGLGLIFGLALIVPYVYYVSLIAVAIFSFIKGSHPFDKSSNSSKLTQVGATVSGA